MKNLISRRLLTSILSVPTLFALGFSANISALELDVVSLTKLSETRITRTEYDYIFAVTVQNGPQAISSAAQTLSASGPGTSILDGNVVIGDIAANAQVTPADTIKIRHDRSVPFNQSAFVWSASGTVLSNSSSSVASSTSAANRVLFNEPFNIDKATLFSAAYRSISTDPSAPLLFVTGGNSGITITNNELTIAAARFTIGNKPPRANTTASDTSANGDLDLSKPYRISFRVLASSGSGALQVMVDNNTTSAGNSLHGSASRLFNAAANSLVAGQMVVLTPGVGTTSSFISFRTESSASVTIDDVVIEYLDDLVTNSSVASSSSTLTASSKSSLAVSTSSDTSSSAITSTTPTSTSASSKSSSSVASYNGAIRTAKIEGFAAHAAVTGGQGGPVVTVSTGTQLNAALCSRSTKTDPIIILVDGTINHSNTTAQGCNTQADVIEIKQMSNISIIGVGTNALFDEIGIHIRDASNIIIQNVHIRNVKKSGSPTSNGGDAIGMETNVNRVWIDHNHLEASGGEKDGYDSLLDMKAGVTNVTVSYNLYNDSSRAGLIGSSDSDNKNTNITFHHNWYKNIEQRTPLIRHALVHMYNNYWSNDRMDYMFHAINSRMNAKALVESNYFYNVNNPLIASDDSSQPGCWQTNNENTVLPSIYYSRTPGNGALVIPEVVDGQLQSTCSVNVPYSVEMDHSSDVPAIVMANAGVGKVSFGDTGSSSSTHASSVAATSLNSSIASSAISSAASSITVIQGSSSSATSSLSSSSTSSSAPYIPDDVNLSADCIRIATNPNVNWRDTALQTDQEIVECLYQTLGTPVGYGENAKGGYDPNGNSKLTIITKNSSKSVEQQILEAISGEEHNWIVFDKVEFAQPHEIGMYRSGCSNATVQSILGATEAECVNYQQWCAKNSVSASACVSTFFNTAMNKSNNPIRNPVIGSNKSIDGRMSEAYFLFSGFAIGKDSTGTPTQTATSVILTHLNFKGAGHTEDHYVDPDMIRSTGASHDIWIHKNTFDTTGDSAFDVKVGAYGITMSFNKILDVKRATLHSSSDSHTIDSQIRTTMHHNLFVTRDASYSALGNTLRRVPLIRRGTSHMLNNVFVNYRKDLLSIRVGGSILQEDNMFVINRIHQEKSSLAASLAELQGNLIRDINGGNYRGEGIFLWFADGACNLDESTKTQITAASGTVANLALQYNTTSQNMFDTWRFSAGQELEDYVSATAGREGAIPFNSPLAADRYYTLPAVPCQ